MFIYHKTGYIKSIEHYLSDTKTNNNQTNKKNMMMGVFYDLDWHTALARSV